MAYFTDVKTQSQALKRTQSVLTLRSGSPTSLARGHAYHGTTSLVAALESVSGKVDGRRFLAAHPRVRFHFIPAKPSWLNLGERCPDLVTAQTVCRHNSESLRLPGRTIIRYLTAWTRPTTSLCRTTSLLGVRRMFAGATALDQTAH